MLSKHWVAFCEKKRGEKPILPSVKTTLSWYAVFSKVGKDCKLGKTKLTVNMYERPVLCKGNVQGMWHMYHSEKLDKFEYLYQTSTFKYNILHLFYVY